LPCTCAVCLFFFSFRAHARRSPRGTGAPFFPMGRRRLWRPGLLALCACSLSLSIWLCATFPHSRHCPCRRRRPRPERPMSCARRAPTFFFQRGLQDRSVRVAFFVIGFGCPLFVVALFSYSPFLFLI
jgi:hypothetical protein